MAKKKKQSLLHKKSGKKLIYDDNKAKAILAAFPDNYETINDDGDNSTKEESIGEGSSGEGVKDSTSND